MGATNATTNLELSQFIGSDSPKWLTDYNGDMEKIDAGYGVVKAQADATDLVVSGHTSSISSLTTTTGEQTTSITNLRTDVNTNTGSINTINSLIGNGTPTTTDQTIIGAINELHSDITASDTDISNLTTDVTAIKKCNTILYGKTYGGGADSVKNWADIGKEAADALLTIANNASYTGKQLFIDAVFIDGMGTFIFAEEPITLTGSLTRFTPNGEFISISDNQCIMRKWQFAPNNNIVIRKAVIDGNGVTTSYESATVPTTGNVTIMYHINNNN